MCNLCTAHFRGGTSYEKLGGQLPPLFQFAPIYWGHMPFLPSSLGHACCDHNESESYRGLALQLYVDIVLTSRQIR